MASKFENISVRDLARGLDQNSAPSNIKDGYAEDLVNVDTNAQGHLSKRVGYQGYDGVLPVRVKSASQTSTEISFTLPDGMDTARMRGRPIVVYGHLSEDPADATDFSTTDTARYYSTVTTDLPVTALAPTGTVTIASAQSGAESTNLFVTALQSTTTINASSIMFFADSTEVEDASDYDVTLDYTVPDDTNLYIAVTDKTTVAGQSYVAEDTISASSTGVISIPTATHGLDSFSILAQCWYHDTSASTWVQFIPDRVAYNATTGDVEVDVTNSSASDLDVKVVLSSAPTDNSTSGTIAGSSTGTIVCTAADIEYYHLSAYQFTGTDWELVVPGSVVFDAVAETITVTLTNSSASSASFQVHWEEATITSNVINVTGTVGASTWTDTTPQLTIWGLPHADSYTGGDAPGHVTHLDTYRREAEERVVAGIGGVLHSARTRSEAGATYLMPSTAVSLQGRITSTQIIGPAFITTGASTERTRGTVAADDVVSNQALITGVTVSSPGVAVYQLSLTNKVGDLSTALDAAGSDSDWLTVTGMANSVNNGTFQITAVDNTNNTVTVSNALATITEFTETGARGRAAVFTDKVTTDTYDFVPGDTMLADGVSLTVLKAGTQTVVVSNATANETLPIGLVLFGQRTSDVVPVEATTNFVIGDMTTVGDYDREVRVLGIVPRADVTVSAITSDGTAATATTATAHGLLVGQKILLYKQAAEGNPYIGTQTVLTTPTTTSFTFASTETTTLTSGVAIKGYTVQLDESLTFSDDEDDADTVAVTGRWIPFEAPTSADELVATTNYRYLDVADYDSQPTVRSTMVTDSLFLTNASDEVYKIDGTHNYQAGLPRWQPQLFVTVDTTTGSIPVRTTSATTAASTYWAQNRFIIGAGEAAGFSVGQLISNPEDDEIYTITAKGSDGTNDLLYVDRDISGTASAETLTEVSRYAYYFRLNAIDANQNIIASAATGAEDFLVDLPSTGQIHLRLVGLPAFGNYDYDALEVQVYRTKANSITGPFYLIRTVDMDFNDGDGYIDIFDGTADSQLTTVLFDEVNSALLGSELGTGWAQPPRAAHITSVDNRLLLANIKDYPELDITVRKTADAVSVTSSDLSGKLWLFRKANTDTSTTTNMVDRARYEFRTSGAVTIAPTADPATSDIVTSLTFVDGNIHVANNTIEITGYTLATYDRVRLTTTGVLPGGLAADTDYYVWRSLDPDLFYLATSIENVDSGTVVDITSAAGGGTHTITVYNRAIVKETAHGLVSGNWIYAFHAAAGTGNRLRYAGWWQVDVASANQFSFRVDGDGTGSTAADVDRYVAASAGVDIPVWLGTDGNRAQVGANDISERTAMLRLAEAINASMRQAVVTSGFTPWMLAAAGSEIGLGRMLVRQESVFEDTMEMVVPAAITSADVYVQGIARTAADQVSASTRLFPSRLVVSYPNYPEIFDNPYAAASDSDSAIDINTADGQEITGVIPFFGESVFGTGAAESVVVAFKTNSIYLVDINSKRINKLNTRGLGCTAPYSIASTKDGIMFANESGVYRLNRDQSISYVGDMIERLWEDSVNKDALTAAVGHHYGVGRKYKLSVPVGADQETNNHVYVYDHERESKDQEFGAWTRYTNHAATSWCNLAADAFFSTTDGQVFKIRNAGDSTDYRDDASAVATMEITLKAMDFGAAGIRKIVSHVTSHFHMRRSDMDGTALTIAPDLTGAFVSGGAFTVTRNANLKVINATSSVPNRKLEFIQLKYTNSTKDEDVILAGVDFRVAGLDRHGIPQSDDIT